MSPVGSIANDDWRQWAKRRPIFRADAPEPSLTFLSSLEQWLEDAPPEEGGLTAQDRVTLVLIVRQQLERANAEVGRAARELLQANINSETLLEAMNSAAGLAPGGKVLGAMAAALFNSDTAARRVKETQELQYRIELSVHILSDRLFG